MFTRLQAPDLKSEPVITPAKAKKRAEMYAGGYGGGAGYGPKCGSGSALGWGRIRQRDHGRAQPVRQVVPDAGQGRLVGQHLGDSVLHDDRRPENPQFPVYKAYDKNGKFVKKIGG